MNRLFNLNKDEFMKIFKHFSSVASFGASKADAKVGATVADAIKHFTLVALMMVFCVGSLSAQEYKVSTDENSFSLSDSEGESVMSIRTTEQSDGFKLSVAGVELNLRPSAVSNNSAVYKKAQNTDHVALIEAGIPTLSLHNAALFNDESFERITDLNFTQSVQINLSIASAYLPFTRDNSVGMSGRIISSWTNYCFNDFTIGRDGNSVAILPVPENTKKSKLTTFAIRVPVELMFCIDNNFFVTAGAYGGLVTGAHTKYKFGKDKKVKDDFSVNPFEAGLTVRAGYGNWYAYCNYSLTDLFKTTTQPGVRSLTFGLATGIFD